MMTKPRKNTLRARAMFELNCWARQNIEALKGLTMGKIAERASVELKFPVSVANIQAVQGVLDVQFNPRPVKADPQKTLVEQLARECIEHREARGIAVDDDMRRLAGIIV